MKELKLTIYSDERVPQLELRNYGGSVYHIYLEGVEVSVVTNHRHDKSAVALEWFDKESQEANR